MTVDVTLSLLAPVSGVDPPPVLARPAIASYTLVALIGMLAPTRSQPVSLVHRPGIP